MWSNYENKALSHLVGLQNSYFATISYAKSLSDPFYLTQMEKINGFQLEHFQAHHKIFCLLDGQQTAIKTDVISVVQKGLVDYYSV